MVEEKIEGIEKRGRSDAVTATPDLDNMRQKLSYLFFCGNCNFFEKSQKGRGNRFKDGESCLIRWCCCRKMMKEEEEGEETRRSASFVF